MGYDSFPFDFEPNEFPFGSKSKGKLLLRSYTIQCERKWNTSFLSVVADHLPSYLVKISRAKIYHRGIVFIVEIDCSGLV